MKIIGIIPARHASSRLPGKALAKIGEYTMIEHVYRQAIQAKCLMQLVVATDHQDIYDEVSQFGGNVVMTDTTHPSGTDRCLEAADKSGKEFDFIINIQGDEPFIDPDQIDLLGSQCKADTEIATLIQPLTDSNELFNPNVVKVVRNSNGEALYFSRATIPAIRDKEKEEWMDSLAYYKHIGMYAYRQDILRKVTTLPQGMLEKAESLEQLRWLEAGYRISVTETGLPTMGIDTPEDLEMARQKYSEIQKDKGKV